MNIFIITDTVAPLIFLIAISFLRRSHDKET